MNNTFKDDWGPTELLDIVIENQKKGMSVAEIGCAEGDTTIRIIQTIIENDGHLYVLDWWKGNNEILDLNHPHGLNFDETVVKNKKNFFIERIEKVAKLITTNNVYDYLTILEGDCLKTIKKIKNKSLDICYIDATHSYDFVKENIKSCIKKVKNGGIISGHDYSKFHPGVTKAVEELFGDNFELKNNEKYQGGSAISSWVVKINK